jgi:hypothetical protein
VNSLPLAVPARKAGGACTGGMDTPVSVSPVYEENIGGRRSVITPL